MNIRISRLRKEKKISQWELAKISGVGRWRIQLLEAGFVQPSPEELTKLTTILMDKNLLPSKNKNKGSKK